MTTREWVVFATERARRPHDFQRPLAPRAAVTSDPSCPFCPGNEQKTPEEVFRIETASGPGWQVRVVPNKFAALSPSASPERADEGAFRRMGGFGRHEVIVEHPRHDLSLALMEPAEIRAVLHAYRARYLALREEDRFALIVIFRNQGAAAGTSLEHPHSQLVATPVVSGAVRVRYETATHYYDDTGRCVHCDFRNEESRAGRRVILESDHFVALHPFASRLPFETWIMPKNHESSFGRIQNPALEDLSLVLKKVLLALQEGLNDPSYNLVIHTAPLEDEDKHYYLWHIQVLPRLTTQAGFELGSGMYINVALPEETAEFMRKLLSEHSW